MYLTRKFFVPDTKKTTNLRLDFRLNKIRGATIAIKTISLKSSDWNADSQRVRPSNGYFVEYNNLIQEIDNRIEMKLINGGFTDHAHFIRFVLGDTSLKATKLTGLIKDVSAVLEMNREESTARHYNAVLKFIQKYELDVGLEELDRKWAKDFTLKLATYPRASSHSKLYSKYTIKQYLSALSRIFEYAVFEGILLLNPIPRDKRLINIVSNELNKDRKVHEALHPSWWWGLEMLTEKKYASPPKSLERLIKKSTVHLDESNIIYFRELEKFVKLERDKRVIKENSKFFRMKYYIRNLTKKELNKLRQVCDAFRFCCMTSFRWSDVINNGKGEHSGMRPKYALYSDDGIIIVKKAFKNRNHKNSSPQKVPISLLFDGRSVTIFNKYKKGKSDNDLLFDAPAHFTSDYNRRLKYIALMLGIDKDFPISSHTGRATASWLFKMYEKIGKHQRMVITGHESEEMDSYYAGDEEERLLDSLRNKNKLT